MLSKLVLYLSEFININPNAIVYAFFILSTYPLSLFYKKWIGYTFLKHIFSILVGITMCYCIFSLFELLHIIIPSVLSVIITHYVNPKYKPDLIVFGGCILYLSALHIHRLLVSFHLWTVDISGVMMLLVIKLTSYSCDVVRLRKNNINSVSTFGFWNWIEWFGYIFYFPILLTGPTLSFEEYKNVSSSNEDDPALKEIESENEQSNALLTSLGTFILLIIGMKFFQATYLCGDAFGGRSFFAKLCIMYITIFLIRCKYYFAWSFSKASCIASGVNTIAATNVNIVNVETATNLRTVLSNWNICSANWLKQYVYMRVIEEKYSATIAIFMTNLVSACWHGFYPGYYLTFFSSGLLTELGKSIRKKITPFFSESNFAYNILCTLSVSFMLAYMAIPFQVFGISETYYAWKNLYFIGHILMIICACVVYLIPNNRPSTLHNSKSNNSEIIASENESVTSENQRESEREKERESEIDGANEREKERESIQSERESIESEREKEVESASENSVLSEPIKPFLSKRNTEDEILILRQLRKRNVEKNDN